MLQNHPFKTVRDVIRYAVSQFQKNNLFFGHGTTNAFDEAAYLILQSLSLPIDQLEPYLDARLLEAEINLILARIEKRVEERIPTAYITNEAYLQGYAFYVDERVIIPRSFIAEVIVNEQLEKWIEHPELIHSVLDLCTGNGSLATIVADVFYDAHVTAVDISESALEVAVINLERFGLAQRVELVQSNLFEKVADTSYDLIVTNPPYVDTVRMQLLAPEYRFEPELALFGGEDGLTLIDKILRQAKYHLNERGILILEMGDNAAQLEARYPDLGFTWIETISGDGFVFVLTKEDLQDYFD